MRTIQLDELQQTFNVFGASAAMLESFFLLETANTAKHISKLYHIKKVASINLAKQYSPEKTKRIATLLADAIKGNQKIIDQVTAGIKDAENAIQNVAALRIKPESFSDTLRSNIVNAPQEVQQFTKQNFYKATYFAKILSHQIPNYQDTLLPEMKRILIKQTAVQQRLELKLKNLSASQSKGVSM